MVRLLDIACAYSSACSVWDSFMGRHAGVSRYGVSWTFIYPLYDSEEKNECASIVDPGSSHQTCLIQFCSLYCLCRIQIRKIVAVSIVGDFPRQHTSLIQARQTVFHRISGVRIFPRYRGVSFSFFFIVNFVSLNLPL